MGCLKFLIFFGVKGRCWVRAYAYGKIRVPPGPYPTLPYLLSSQFDRSRGGNQATYPTCTSTCYRLNSTDLGEGTRLHTHPPANPNPPTQTHPHTQTHPPACPSTNPTTTGALLSSHFDRSRERNQTTHPPIVHCIYIEGHLRRRNSFLHQQIVQTLIKYCMMRHFI